MSSERISESSSPMEQVYEESIEKVEFNDEGKMISATVSEIHERLDTEHEEVMDAVEGEIPRKLKKMHKRLKQIDETTCETKKMMKGMKHCLKEMKESDSSFKSMFTEYQEECKNREEKEMMYGNGYEAVPTVNVAPTVGAGVGGFGGYGMGAGLLEGLLFGALINNNRFGNGFGAGAIAGDGINNCSSNAILGAVQATDRDVLSGVNQLGIATANQSAMLGGDICNAVNTLQAGTLAQTNALQSDFFSGTAALASGISKTNADVMMTACDTQRQVNAGDFNILNAMSNLRYENALNTMQQTDNVKSMVFAQTEGQNSQFDRLQECCCNTEKTVMQGDFGLSTQLCNTSHDIERGIFQGNAALASQANTNANNLEREMFKSTSALAAQNCQQTNQIERDLFTLNLGTERQLNQMAKDSAECCCEQKMLTTMGFSNLQNEMNRNSAEEKALTALGFSNVQHSMDKQFCHLREEMLEDKLRALELRNAEARDAIRDHALASAINTTLTNGFTQLGAIFNSNVIPAISAAAAAR